MFCVSFDKNFVVLDVFDTSVYVDEGVELFEITEDEKNAIWKSGNHGLWKIENNKLVRIENN